VLRVRAAGEGARAEPVHPRAVQPPDDARGHRAELRLAAVQLAAGADDAVVGHRLHHLVAARAARVQHGGALLGGEGVHHADRPAAPDLAAQLGGAQDVRLPRLVRVAALGHVHAAARGTAHPA
jgi:hypothetical protein